jgi:hypothetical protein
MAKIDSLGHPLSARSDVSRDAEKRAREERIDHHWASFREQMAIMDEIIGEWRAEGILPPEEPRRRV